MHGTVSGYRTAPTIARLASVSPQANIGSSWTSVIGAMWQVVREPEEIPEALRAAPPWSENAREFAAVR